MNCEVCWDECGISRCTHCSFRMCNTCYDDFITSQPKELAPICPICKRPMHILEKVALEMTGKEAYNKLQQMHELYRKPYQLMEDKYDKDERKNFRMLSAMQTFIHLRLSLSEIDDEDPAVTKYARNLMTMIENDMVTRDIVNSPMFPEIKDDTLMVILDAIDKKLEGVDIKHLKYKDGDFIDYAARNWVHEHKKKVSHYPDILFNCICGGLVMLPDYKCNECGKCFCSNCWQEKHEGKCNDEWKKLNEGAKPCPVCGTLYKHNGGCDKMYCTKCKTQYYFDSGEIIIGRMVDLKPTDELGKTMFGLKAQVCSLEDIDPDEMDDIMYEVVLEKFPFAKHIILDYPNLIEETRKYLARAYIKNEDAMILGQIIEALHFLKRLYHRAMEFVAFAYFQEVTEDVATRYVKFIMSEFVKSVENMKHLPKPVSAIVVILIFYTELC